MDRNETQRRRQVRVTTEEIGDNESYKVFDGMGAVIINQKNETQMEIYMNGQLIIPDVAIGLIESLHGRDREAFLDAVTTYRKIKGKVFTVEIKKGEEEDG